MQNVEAPNNFYERCSLFFIKGVNLGFLIGNENTLPDILARDLLWYDFAETMPSLQLTISVHYHPIEKPKSLPGDATVMVPVA